VALKYVKPGSSVVVEPSDACVVVVTREGSHAPHVDRCPAGDPASLAEGIGRYLTAEGYELAG